MLTAAWNHGGIILSLCPGNIRFFVIFFSLSTGIILKAIVHANNLFSLEVAFCVLFKTHTVFRGLKCHRILSFTLRSIFAFLKNTFLDSCSLSCGSLVSILLFVSFLRS